jgi:hypothetical protein
MLLDELLIGWLSMPRSIPYGTQQPGLQEAIPPLLVTVQPRPFRQRRRTGFIEQRSKGGRFPVAWQTHLVSGGCHQRALRSRIASHERRGLSTRSAAATGRSLSVTVFAYDDVRLARWGAGAETQGQHMAQRGSREVFSRCTPRLNLP